MNRTLTSRERIQGALWGAVMGDALGVPVEFTDRSRRQADPVTGPRGGGTWNQPIGTWSDDSSLLLCTVECLLDGFDPDRLGRRFVEWGEARCWTPWGVVFDMGNTTRQALQRIKLLVPALHAGGTDEGSNGNGSLMRILPIALIQARTPVRELAELCHQASALTHGHARSLMACTYYCLLARQLLAGLAPLPALAVADEEFLGFYASSPWKPELEHFRRLSPNQLPQLPEHAIQSSGYVVDTLTASIWCLLNTQSYSDAVLQAVNLGGDTDTTGIVTGGLAGLVYGHSSVPEEWTRTLARHADLEVLFGRFTTHCLQLQTGLKTQ